MLLLLLLCSSSDDDGAMLSPRFHENRINFVETKKDIDRRDGSSNFWAQAELYNLSQDELKPSDFLCRAFFKLSLNLSFYIIVNYILDFELTAYKLWALFKPGPLSPSLGLFHLLYRDGPFCLASPIGATKTNRFFKFFVASHKDYMVQTSLDMGGLWSHRNRQMWRKKERVVGASIIE